MATTITSGFELIIAEETVQSKDILSWAKSNADCSVEWQASIAAFILTWCNNETLLHVKTSGSTGVPKVISIEKSKMTTSAQKTNQFFNLNSKSTALLALSANYIAGKMMLVRAMIGGYKLYAVEPTSNPLSTLKIHIEFAPLVPMQVLPHLNKSNSVDTILLGGAPIPAKYVNDIKNDLETNYFQSFGMTETVSHIALKALNGPFYSEYYKCVKGVSISSNSDKKLIIHAPDLLEEPLQTNDIVELQNKHEFKWLGRADFVINSGGVKIHPEEVEKKLAGIIQQNHFIWKEADELLLEKVILVVETNSQHEELEKLLEGSPLSRYEKPKTVYTVSAFRYTDTGKVKRQETFELAKNARFT